jgi:hypothetical protein
VLKVTNIEQQIKTRPVSLPQNCKKNKPPKQDDELPSATTAYTRITSFKTYHFIHKTHKRPCTPTYDQTTTPTSTWGQKCGTYDQLPSILHIQKLPTQYTFFKQKLKMIIFLDLVYQRSTCILAYLQIVISCTNFFYDKTVGKGSTASSKLAVNVDIFCCS